MVPSRLVASCRLRSVLLGAMIGLGGAIGATTLVRTADAAGLIETLFGESPRRIEALAPIATRPVLGALRRVPRPERAIRRSASPLHLRPGATPRADRRAAIGGARTVCVRTCDGFMFPLATLRAKGDLDRHRSACAAACPGAETALYTLAGGRELDQAVSLGGQPYRRLASALVYRTRSVPGCTCHPGGTTGPVAHAIARDPTLHMGDAVAMRDTAAIFTGRGAGGQPLFADFRRSAAVSSASRQDLDRILDVSRRERVRAAFRLELARTARAAAKPVRLAEAGGFTVLSARAAFAPVRVVAPSPYR
ncbi:DUF2865 domain-containing protein [Methylobacterium sp. ID0610]|uniref:DUF2865 domain-containing protein n=1 Tax=Methylobacterium carpenticola TaxID=3344827 RepID=UPI0036924BDB